MFNEAGQEKEIKPTFLCAGFTDGGETVLELLSDEIKMPN